MKRSFLWIIPLAVFLLLLLVLVPNAMPVAEAEDLIKWYELEDLPVYQPVTLENPSPKPVPLGSSTPYAPHAEGFLPDDTGYVDSTISVRVEERHFEGVRDGKKVETNIQFTWIQIADPTQLRTATYRPYPSKSTAKASKIAQANQSVLAISGDWFMSEEKLKRGVVYRNGTQYREKDCGVYDALIIDMQGDFHILRHAKVEDFAPYSGTIMHSFVFGPALVIDGELVKIDRNDDRDDWVIRHNEGWHGAQRNVLCQMGELSYLVITSDGPEQNPPHGGFSIQEIARLAYDMGAIQAFNLDGGSSAWLVLGDKRINTRNTKNFRQVGDIIYFVTAEP